VAVDSQGDVFVADSLNSELKEMLASGGSVPLSNPQIITFASSNNLGNTQYVSSIAIDASNDVFFTGNGEVNELAQAANFGQLTVGVGSETNPTTSQDPYQFLVFGFASQGSIKAPVVYTQGVTGQDFTDHLTGTCTTNGTSYVYGNGTNDDTCTVIAQLTPRYPGKRLGAVQLSASGGGVIATAPLLGNGLGPIATFQATKGTAQVSNVLPSGYTQGVGCIAIDAARNIYYSILAHGGIFKLPWGGSSYGAPINIGGSFSFGSSILGCAVDGAGDVFAGDPFNGQIVEIPWNGSGYGAPFQALDTSALYNTPTNIAIDGAGNLYFSSFYGAYAYESKVQPNGTYTSYTQLPFTTLISAYGIALDANGDVFATNQSKGTIVELPATASGFKPEVIVATGLNNIGQGMQIDPAGDLYYGGVNASPVELAWNGTSYTVVGPIYPNGISPDPNDIALDPRGNVFEAGADIKILELDWVDPPSLSFNNTATGATSTDSPKYVNVSNIGNGALLFSGTTDPTYPADFPKGGNATPVCATGNSIFLGASCYIGVNFMPVNVGPLSENVALKDNDLYVSGGVTQNIAVSGTATGLPAPTVNWGPLAGVNYGTALPLSIFNATFTTLSTNLTNDGTITYYVSSVGGTVATASTILPAGSDTLCVQWVPGGEYSGAYSSASLCLPITVSVASTSISWTPVSPIGLGAALGSGQFNATASSGSTPVSSDGTFTYYLNAVGGTVANSSTVLPAGANTVCVQWTPSSSYTADYNSSQACTTIQVNAGTTINWTPSTPITYPSTLGNSQFNATAFSGATNIGADGTFTYYVGSVGGTVATSGTVLQGGAETLCVQWTPSSSFTSQYSSASQCSPITVNAGSTSVSWSPSSSTIIASSGPTAGQLDAAGLNGGSSNITADGTITYHLSTAGGTVITTGATLPLGANTICAVWAPASSYALDYNGSSTCQSFTVINTQPTTATLAANANPVFSTNSVTFTATVTPTSGTIVPTGTVTFLDGTTVIGTGTLSASGSGASAIAKLTLTTLPAGSQSITAVYAGDTNNQASTSAAVGEVVEDFSVTANAPASATIEPGTSATYSITVSPVSPATTFPAAITLSAANLPTGATVTFSPAGIASGAGSTNVTMTVTVPITTLARNERPGRAPAPKWPAMAVALLLLPLAGRLRRAGRAFSRMLSLLLLAAAGMTAAAALNGCGGVASGYFGQSPATSSITVTGTSGSLNHSASVSLTVE